jgi:hypothetical protein
MSALCLQLHRLRTNRDVFQRSLVCQEEVSARSLANGAAPALIAVQARYPSRVAGNMIAGIDAYWLMRSAGAIKMLVSTALMSTTPHSPKVVLSSFSMISRHKCTPLSPIAPNP